MPSSFIISVSMWGSPVPVEARGIVSPGVGEPGSSELTGMGAGY